MSCQRPRARRQLPSRCRLQNKRHFDPGLEGPSIPLRLSVKRLATTLGSTHSKPERAYHGCCPIGNDCVEKR